MWVPTAHHQTRPYSTARGWSPHYTGALSVSPHRTRCPTTTKTPHILLLEMTLSIFGSKDLMKQYSHRYLSRQERICNYRFSRGRCVVENAFEILANQFRCLLTTMRLRPANVVRVAKACLTLHNILRMRYPRIQNADLDREDDQGQLIPGVWQDNAVMKYVLAAGHGPRTTAAGNEQKAYLKNYFNSLAGSVPWQDLAIDNWLLCYVHVCDRQVVW